jgi:hypothetical protein
MPPGRKFEILGIRLKSPIQTHPSEGRIKPVVSNQLGHFTLDLINVFGLDSNPCCSAPASVEHTYFSGRLKVAPPKIAAQG